MKQDEKKKLKALKKAQKNTISFADDESNHTKKFRGEEKRYGKLTIKWLNKHVKIGEWKWQN